MSVRLRELLLGQLGELRHEPIDKRIRATLGGQPVVDSTRALLVWEPKRLVPSYAVPAEDIRAEVTAAPTGSTDAAQIVGPQLGARPILDPSVPFAAHSADGRPVTIRAPEGDGAAEGFRLDDPDLRDYVVLDFEAFDAWYEEGEPNVGHPRDPFHRIEILHSSRHVQIERDGQMLAESTSPYLLFEPPLPVRYYLAPDDVATELLRPSAKVTFCAYKGQASYFALGDTDVAWTYVDPLREAAEVAGRIAFFNEAVDIAVDGARLERPVTPWSGAATPRPSPGRGERGPYRPRE